MKIESTLSEPLLSSDSEKEETSVPVQTGLRKGTFVKEAGLVVGFTTKTFLLISTIVASACGFCWFCSIYDSVYTYKSWLTLWGSIVALVALILEFETSAVFLVLTSFFLLFNLISAKDSLKGLASPGLMAVAVMQPVANILDEFGTIEAILGVLLGRSDSMHVSFIRMLATISILSAFLSNTAVVLICVPNILKFTSDSNFPKAAFLLPLSYVSLLGGMCTLLGTSTNLIIKEISKKDVHIEMFTMFPVGVACLISGSIVLSVIKLCCKSNANKVLVTDVGKTSTFLPYRVTFKFLGGTKTMLKSLHDLNFDSSSHDNATPIFVEIYEGGEVITKASSDLTSGEQFSKTKDVTFIHEPTSKILNRKLKKNDVVCFACTAEGVASLRRLKYLIIDGKRKDEYLFNTNQLDLPGRTSRRLFEIIPTSKCSLVQLDSSSQLNKRVQGVLFDKYQFIVLATSNVENTTSTDNSNNENEDTDSILSSKMAVNSTITAETLILVEANKTFLLGMHKDFPFEFKSGRKIANSAPPRVLILRDRIKKMGSLFVFALMLILVICEVYHVFTAAVLALSFCVGIGLLSVKDIVGTINLNMMITLVCSFSMAAAIDNHRVGEPLQHFCLSIATNETIMLTMVYLLSTVLTNIISNNAAAILLWSIFSHIANEAGYSKTRVALALMMGCSSPFLSPVGYQTNCKYISIIQ
jgi:di/tricarboxylate transporter